MSAETPTPEIPKNIKESIGLLIGGRPEVLFLMSGGIKKTKDGSYKATTVIDGDLIDGGTYGYLGGIYRALATEHLAKIYPDTPIVTNSSDPKTGQSHADVYADTLIRRGVDSDRIIRQSASHSTRDEFKQMINLSLENNWKGPVALITNDYHLERSVLTFASLDNLFREDKEFLGQLEQFWDRGTKVLFVNSEKVLDIINPRYKKFFAELRTTEPFASAIELRELWESNGIRALEEDNYQKRF